MNGNILESAARFIRKTAAHGEGINQGLAHAAGQFFKVVDSDDWVNEAALKRVLDAIRGMDSP